VQNDLFPEVLFSREERPNDQTYAFLDARLLRNYIEHRLRQYIASNADRRIQSFTEDEIKFVGEALEFSALRLPSNQRTELWQAYADRPERVSLQDIEAFGNDWDADYQPDNLTPEQHLYRTGNLQVN